MATARAARSSVETPRAVAALLFGLAAVLAFRIAALAINGTDLFFDEAQYWSWGREPAFGYYSKPPLIAWIIGSFGALCGDSPFCIRLAAPLLHTATALLIYLIGRRLHEARIGVWAALTFATLPGVSLSAGIISTDAPLLTCWAAALLAFVALVQGEDGWWPAFVLGLGLGLGLNAKYAMVFFPLSMAIYLAVTPKARLVLADPRLWAGLALGGLLIAPNMAWNLANSFATFAHTADNARWGGSLINVGKGLEFIAAQFGVFGPILFAALVLIAVRAWREGLPEQDRLLLCFTLPVLLIIAAQAFVSRAHANWAATAYVAGTLLVTAAFARLAAGRWQMASMALHLATMLVIALGTAFAGQFTLPRIGDPFQRTLGWRELGNATTQILDTARATGQPFRAVVADDRSLTAEFLYYMRHDPTPIMAWRPDGRPHDHYELTRPYKDPAQAPVLLVSIRKDASAITRQFRKTDLIAERDVPAGLGEPRRVRYYALSGYRKN